MAEDTIPLNQLLKELEKLVYPTGTSTQKEQAKETYKVDKATPKSKGSKRGGKIMQGYKAGGKV